MHHYSVTYITSSNKLHKIARHKRISPACAGLVDFYSALDPRPRPRIDEPGDADGDDREANEYIESRADIIVI